LAPERDQKARHPGVRVFSDKSLHAIAAARPLTEESVIMKITGHHTRGVFEPYNITDQSDTLEAGRLAEEFLDQAHAQNSSQNRWRPN
jgi:hypothetical protein